MTRTMPARAWLIANLLCGVAPAQAEAPATDDLSLRLEVGEQHVLPSAGVHGYSEGVLGIVDVRLTKEATQFVVVGLRPGRTSLLLMMNDGRELQYKIEVVDQNGRSEQQALQPLEVQPRDNIRLDFYFVQISRDGWMRTGVQWPASFGGGSLQASFDLRSGALDEATAMVTDQALPRLDLAQSEGWAKLLRQAAVITANGTEATFVGGGEINLPVEGALSVGVRQIEFGSRIKVMPRYDRNSGRIELGLHAEVSDLAADHGSGIPGRVLSQLDSVVNLELGQTLVIAGLSARSEGATHSGLPGLSQIPIIGLLFGTHQVRDEQSENLIFIVPSVADAVSPDAREHVREALETFTAYEGEPDAHLRSIDAALTPRAQPVRKAVLR